MIKLTGIGHVLLRVADQEASKRFYRDVLGFVIAEEDPEHGGVFMTLGENFHTLDIGQHPSPETAQRRAAALCTPIAIEESAIKPACARPGGLGPLPHHTALKATRSASSTASVRVSRGDHTRRSRPGSASRAPNATPSPNPTSASTEFSTRNPCVCPIANPSNTALPVMLAVSTRSRPR